MTPERWRQVAEAFEAALELSGEERKAFLQQLETSDSTLRTEVETLLAEDAAHPAPEGPTPGAAGAAGMIGRRIGSYEIVRVIGEGGMGVVFEARQEQPRRAVALKVLKPGLAGPEVVRRFERESQVLARLQHPGIAQIYEAGTADTGFGPQPYFAMELIQGMPLREYAESRQLSTRQRLEIMALVCDAVEHAHQRGIIHRDLKPGNILVDETGQPKVLDFGVARVTDSDIQVTRQTDVGQLIGTLSYMSPEQVLADPLELDTRSDVYALGVVLYELLAKRLPYPVSHLLHEAVRVIREEDPTKLSSINRAFRGDVETIVSRALEKDKARRYASASGLATDVRRYLADEPIMARPASATYQLRKFARRHKGLVSAVGVMFAVLVAGILVTTREAARARQAEQTAQAVNDFLQNDLLAQASASTQASPNTKPDPDLKVRTALDRAAARIGGKFNRQPEVEAAIRDTIGQTYIDLGLYKEARRQLERALELRRRVLGVDHPKTLHTVSPLGTAVLKQGKFPEAEALLHQNLEMQRRVLGSTHPDTLATMNNLGIVYTQEGKYKNAEAIQSEALDIRRRVLGPEHPFTLSSMTALANVYEEDGKFDRAEPLYIQALEIERRVLGSEHPRVFGTMNDLANVYEDQGRYAQAEALYVEALEGRRRVLGPEHPDTLSSMMNLGVIYRHEGKQEQAERLYSQTLEIQRRALGVEHRLTLMCMNNLANVYWSQGKWARAEALQEETLEVKSRVLGPEHRDTLISMHNLANTYAVEGRYAESEALFKRALDAEERILGALHRDTLSTLSDFALMYQRQGKYALAETHAAEMLTRCRRALGSEHPLTVGSAADLALAYVSQGKFIEAEPLTREAVAYYRKNQSEGWTRFGVESLLGASLAGQKKYQEAGPLLIEGYEGVEARKNHIELSERFYLDRAGEWLVQLYLAWGKPEKAAEWRRKITVGTEPRAFGAADRLYRHAAPSGSTDGLQKSRWFEARSGLSAYSHRSRRSPRVNRTDRQFPKRGWYQ